MEWVWRVLVLVLLVGIAADIAGIRRNTGRHWR
jgi:hypothetical protein